MNSDHFFRPDDDTGASPSRWDDEYTRQLLTPEKFAEYCEHAADQSSTSSDQSTSDREQLHIILRSILLDQLRIMLANVASHLDNSSPITSDEVTQVAQELNSLSLSNELLFECLHVVSALHEDKDAPNAALMLQALFLRHGVRCPLSESVLHKWREGDVPTVDDAPVTGSHVVECSSSSMERAVLGGLLLCPEGIDEVAMILTPEDFELGAHQLIFGAILDMYEAGIKIDVLLLGQRLKDSGEYVKAGGAGYLAELAEETSTASNTVHYSKSVRDYSIRRQYRKLLSTLTSFANSDGVTIGEVLQDSEDQIHHMMDVVNDSTTISLAESLCARVNSLEALESRESAPLKLPTGFPQIDNVTGGLEPGKLFLLAAQPGCSMFSLTLSIASHTAVDVNLPTLVVSPRASALEIGDRVLLAREKISPSALSAFALAEDQAKQLIQAAAQISKAPLYIQDTSRITVSQIAASARSLRQRCGLSLIVVDRIDLILPGTLERRYQTNIEYVAQKLQHLGRQLGVPVLCTLDVKPSINLAVASSSGMTDLYDYGTLVDIPDVVICLERRASDVRTLVLHSAASDIPVEVSLIWDSELGCFDTADVDQLALSKVAVNRKAHA